LRDVHAKIVDDGATRRTGEDLKGRHLQKVGKGKGEEVQCRTASFGYKMDRFCNGVTFIWS